MNHYKHFTLKEGEMKKSYKNFTLFKFLLEFIQRKP